MYRRKLIPFIIVLLILLLGGIEVQNAISMKNSEDLGGLQNNEIIAPEPIFEDENFVLLQQGAKMPGMENLAFIEADLDGYHFFGQSGTSAHWLTIHNNESFSDIVLGTLPSGSYNSITTGDVDGDGYLDAVLGMSFTNQYLVVLLNSDTKSIKRQYLSLARGQFPNGAQILDFDNDGINEIIFQHGDGNPQIAVYKLDPINDIFVDISTISEGFNTNSPQPGGLITGDIDNNGNIEIISTGDAMGVAIYEIGAPSSLTFIRNINEYSYGQELQRPLFPQLGDRDDDGWDELYFFEDQTQTVHIVDPKIPSSLQVLPSAGPVRDLRVIDLNYDGFDDMVVTTDLQIYVSYSNGQEHTELQPFSVTEISRIANRGSWIYDFNGDKSLDILVNGQENRIFYGYKNGTDVEIYDEAAPTIEKFGQYINDGDFLDRALLHDFDQDGSQDMLLPYWFKMNLVAGPSFDTYYQTPDFNPPASTAEFRRVDYVDINLDGFDDFVAMGELMIITENSGDFNDFGQLSTYYRDMTYASAGQRGTIKFDMNGDQHDDLIFIEGSQVYLLEAAKDFYTQYPSAQLLFTLANFYDEDAGMIQSGNFVGDYNNDLIIPLQGGQLAVLEFVNGSFSQELFTLPQWGPIIGSAQYDTDSYLELYIETTSPAQKFVDVVLNFDTPVLVVERLNIIAEDTGNFLPQAFGDINHDGKPDFIFTDTIYLYVWTSTDGSTYYLADQITVNSNVLTTLLVDHDKDGFKDLIMITHQQIYLYWMVSTHLFDGNSHFELIEFTLSGINIQSGSTVAILLVVRKDLEWSAINTVRIVFRSSSGYSVEGILFEDPVLMYQVHVSFYEPGEYGSVLYIESNDGSSTSFGSSFAPLFTIIVLPVVSTTTGTGISESSETGFTTQSGVETVTETIPGEKEDTGPPLPVPINGYLVILSMFATAVIRRRQHNEGL